MKVLFYVAIVGIYLQKSQVAGTTTIQVPSAGNCGDDTVLTCQFNGSIGTTGWYGLNRSLVKNGVPQKPEDNNKYTETRGTSSFTLTIHNTDITDEGDYKCSNGFDESQSKHLNIECKASSSTHSVTRGKKVQIKVDKLYPASPTVTATFNRQNSTIQISGSSACSSSPQYTGYYKCVWTSRNSLDEGVYTYSIVVTTITQVTLTGSFKIASPNTPLISNVVQLNATREVVYGNEGQSLTIQCTSTGGYPTQTVTWYKNSISSSNQLSTTSSGTLQSDGTYTVNLQHTFTPATSDDRKYLICRSYYPQADSAQVGSNSKSVLLYLTLKPNQPTVTQTSVVSAGSTVTVRCTTSGCRPAASISWLYQGVTYNGSTTNTPDATTETFTVFSTYTRQVTAGNNGQNIQCIVTHPALVSPAQLTKSTNLNVQFSVGPSTTNITGNSDIIATGSTPLTLTCTTGSSNPASDITWRHGSHILESNRPYTTSTGVNNGVVRSQQLILYPTRYMDGDNITCSVSNSVSQSPVVDKVKLNLKYRPLVKPMSDVIVVEGNNTELICATSSKPASTFKWYKQGQEHKVLHQGTGTMENNKLSYPLTNVRRGDAATYTCNANNGIENADNKNILLTVYYPPEVSATSTNTTINAISVVLTCNANGVPNNNYIYGRWVQSWPGIDVPVSQHQGSEKLELKDLTYEHSGVYSCSASNGINVFGTTQIFMEGSVNLVVKSFPIIVKVDEIIAGSLNSNSTVVVKYYSNVEETRLKIYKHGGNEKNKEIIYRVNEFPIDVELPVFEHNIKTRGIEASIIIQINSDEDFGYYFLVVSNEIGSSNISFQIRMEGPPNKPVDITVDYIKYNEARLSWMRGFHGGLKQTFVLQLSTDGETWRDINVYDGIVDNSEKVTKLITDLKDSTTYHVRMYAFNNAGNSPLTATVKFTTPTIKRENDGQTKDYSTVTVGIVLGCCLVALAIYAIYVTVELRKTRAISQRKDLSTEAGSITYSNMANVSSVIKQEDDANNENQYTELKRDKKVESAYETLTSM